MGAIIAGVMAVVLAITPATPELPAPPPPTPGEVELAHIIEGEAANCSPKAKRLVAATYQANPVMYGWRSPAEESIRAAQNWRSEPHRPLFVFSGHDLQQPRVQKLIQNAGVGLLHSELCEYPGGGGDTINFYGRQQ